MTDLTGPDGFSNSDEKNLIIPTDSIPPAAWQAIYYHLTKKVEVTRKLYNGAFEIKKDDLIDLYYRIDQSITGYGPKAKKIEFDIEFRKDSSEKLSGIEKYSSIDFTHKRSCTKRIAIDFDFILSPSTELDSENGPAQKFKIFIILDQDFFADDDPEQSGFFPDGVAGKNILSVIEYSDYSVSRSLQSAIDDWVETLPKREVSSALKTLPKLMKWFRGSLPAIASSFILIPFIRFSSPENFENSVVSILTAASFTFFMFGLLKWFVSWSLDTIAKLQPTTYIIITQGDNERRDNINSSHNRRQAVFYFIFAAVILSFIIGTTSSIFASYIMSQW